MAERIIKATDAHYCQGTHVVQVLATHNCTDARQLSDGGWEETAPRYGCAEHPVKPNVILLNGTVVPFEDYCAS